MGKQAKKRAFLTPAEAATLLRVHRRTVYDAVRRGDLPAYQIGGRIRISRKELRAYLNRNRTGPPPAPPPKPKGLTKREREEAQRIMDRLL